ncbi:hypothetical protein MTR67_007092 [Solanum verrucosum]|uniref:Uncharacterized protein n=1 Tax=Solanum verrucosum TaxID=315347 RepID=A0AAF0PZ70_SOLVR|nr:hypothetical protein MTR67_007092 [Solanum verrucosum]
MSIVAMLLVRFEVIDRDVVFSKNGLLMVMLKMMVEPGLVMMSFEAKVRGQRYLKSRPSHCLTSPRGSSRPVVATTSRGATRGGKGTRVPPRVVVPLMRREVRHRGDLESRVQGLASMNLRLAHDLHLTHGFDHGSLEVP